MTYLDQTLGIVHRRLPPDLILELLELLVDHRVELSCRLLNVE